MNVDENELNALKRRTQILAVQKINHMLQGFPSNKIIFLHMVRSN
jgi:hypothetical protein